MSQFGGGGDSFSGKGGGEREGAVPVVPAFSMKSGGTHGFLSIKVDVESEGLDVNVGCASLCDAITTALLLHHSDSIMRGRTAIGGPQRRLDPDGQQGKAARKGQRPDVRGYTGTERSFPEVLTRGPMRVSTKPVRIGGTTAAQGPRVKGRRGPRAPNMGWTAAASIEPANNLHAEWLVEEFARGVDYFHTVGEADRVITRVVTDYLATATNGENRTYQRGRFTAREAR